MVNEVINYAEKRKQLSFLPPYDARNTVMFNKILNLQINI